jgi:hypothetical protein
VRLNVDWHDQKPTVLPPLPRWELGRHIRARLPGLIADESGAVEPGGFAIYTLSDPRDLRRVRYVGQTRAPQRRLLQHLHTARLWLPDEVPWWFAAPELRPLYDWIRALHWEDYRLPAMLITDWKDSIAAARLAERELILHYLGAQHELLNVERELLASQLVLPYR